jgi:hypothetical protein
MENESQKDKETIEGFEIDGLDLLNGKMKNVAIEQLCKKIRTMK